MNGQGTRSRIWLLRGAACFAAVAAAALLLMALRPAAAGEGADSKGKDKGNVKIAAKSEIATFGSGCFWCTEAVFERHDGVSSVVSGYSGGLVKNPSYRSICTGRTGHAEVVRIEFNPEVVSYSDLLDLFWRSHDPTTLNRQGADKGTQYRSVIFTHSKAQAEAAKTDKETVDKSGTFKDPIVTEIREAPEFYEAEAYHQDYYRTNPYAGYCQAIIAPKLKKLDKKNTGKAKK